MSLTGMVTMTVLCAGVVSAAEKIESLELAAGKKTLYTIVLAADATPVEKHAADELAGYLKQISGAEFVIQSEPAAGQPWIAVGAGSAAKLAPDIDLKGLGSEGIIVRSTGTNLILTGGPKALRGTLYAVYTFLEDCCGVHWWSPDATEVPARDTLNVAAMDIRFVPVMEYRDPFIKVAFDAEFAAHNKINGPYRNFSEAQGGGIEYALFVHSFYDLAPPKEFFAQHPEWYSEVDGKRVAEKAQLCLTNPDLLAHVKQCVRQWIKDNPKASIVSISQNDCLNSCQCAACRKANEEEGSPSGPLLKFVNAVAEDIAADYPNIAVDTLAYQYTRKPPKTVRPRENVIIRLCSIECSFLQPLNAEPNKSFREDMEGWSKICNRLYVWDYVINFGHYLMPHPNLRVLEPNIRFFVKHNVKGVLEQGNNRALGGEFEELKAWVLAKLLWNPELKASDLIDDFLRGYYGKTAPNIRLYIDFLHDRAEATKFFLPIDEQFEAPYLDYQTMAVADRVLQQALADVADDPVLKKRVERVASQTRYVFALRWPQLKREAAQRHKDFNWPLTQTRDEVIADLVRVCDQNQIGALFEDWSGDQTPHTEALKQRYGGRHETPEVTGATHGFTRLIPELKQPGAIDLQDELFSLWERPQKAMWKEDAEASDGKAVWMPGDHNHWCVYLPTSDSVFRPVQGQPVTAYAVVRVDKTGDQGVAFKAGVYDNGAKKAACEISINCKDIAEGYHVYELGVFTPNRTQYFWAAPSNNGANVKSVWIDRFIVVPGNSTARDRSFERK